MKLVKISQWIADNFDERTAPTPITVARWIKQKKLSGATIGGLVYVDADAMKPHYSQAIIGGHAPASKPHEKLDYRQFFAE